ncbi:antitoxin Xre/MbcA/ParS toxin-binding domain-containing protein [Brumimicrobium aurantiacum]|uniref:DUF2384 domain-containing protein n=1 Tax=Brumimicrobium aurantiacum TaxID=1737063 RepID=A0A3E1F011_9FLAO|nr:MbcA/ParS/Xre antitoxin family protein [Brumimicrobium aurantiacum]RFC55063.1 DUF2384 domain-containing protein [Brumimicrobium aurantiacum]
MKNKEQQYKIEDTPSTVSDVEMIYYMNTVNIATKEFQFLKKLAQKTDKIISDWFNISEKTYQNYKSLKTDITLPFKEKFLLIVALYKKGEIVFGSKEAFNSWLDTPNFHFNNEAPVDFFKTISGIRYIEDRLTGIEYGDNA